ncbi:iron-containing alcohol dehydrogenase [Pseudoalteromonas sp. SSMSWG5]|jgi:NADP-dependent alcohol dehydrogenase|uniref:iron-containing alcohol dehydrogenase n=2 Tax=Pseudoalteromonas TaxID=53246 RepID=UPI000C647E3F|nr:MULTISPECIES: iron-containing alcohol dehydrogenase [unclassified Pseudoalteromonas]MBU76573.1 NADH-dependent alcohol dehydrogenase [Pseudoalteromonadaceae bacterium]HCV04400.1 NADH-dependent alcohol dehydrogenase [Pseudoalteromonas sp.]MCF2900606.1 iron-containing alcohol dehydrogenase [Pseudoalteromonas sp. OFAV1]MCO7249974.1 iron-containing alcohol dehydrogenase [Pseudoalteromonas sp. Ps84H-4]TGV21175.1 iron-containing alcohol dehydrogenase [Pseudoalteromonas sp. MEBiC 03607]|tara:strand:+ start:2885 stop:4039 length:1155 start_codon:yes stop_codon:yes gene_type:complete
MLNFIYKNQTEILFGKGQISEISSRLPTDAKVLLLYGGGSIKKNGVYDQAMSALADVDVIEFGGVEPNPTYETLMQAVTTAKEHHVNFILAVGGGSVIDGAKFVAAAYNYAGEPWDILVKGAEFSNPLPIGAVLTLPATGSESNGNSVVTKKETSQKRAFSSPTVQPVFAVLDPEYTFSLPARQVSNGVVDAFVHVIEQYLTYPVNAPLQDRFAEGILQTLISEGPKALSEPQNYDVRANVMWSATMALNGLIGQGVPQDWSTHMIGHELTALYNLDHAQTLAIVLPALMHVQKEQKSIKIQQLGERVFGLNYSDEAEQIDKTIKAVQDFFEAMTVKTRLADYDLDEQAIEAVVANLEKNELTKLGEHGDIDLEKVKSILALAL